MNTQLEQQLLLSPTTYKGLALRSTRLCFFVEKGVIIMFHCKETDQYLMVSDVHEIFLRFQSQIDLKIFNISSTPPSMILENCSEISDWRPNRWKNELNFEISEEIRKHHQKQWFSKRAKTFLSTQFDQFRNRLWVTNQPFWQIQRNFANHRFCKCFPITSTSAVQ